MKQDLDKMIDKALKTEFEFSMSTDFALKVVRNMETISAVSDRRFNWLIGSIFSLTFIAGLITMMILSEEKSLLMIKSYLSWIIIIPFTVVIIQYLDKKLVKQKFHA
jgi:hypothetical protein